jgi:hypothetical protein
VAGIVDGEGCLSLIERTNEECVRRSFSFRLSVEMGDKAKTLLTMIQSRLGGTLQARRRDSNPKHQGRIVWNIHTRHALPVLEAMLPHMVVKAEQCRLCISACRLILEKPEGFGESLATAKALMHELNRTGQIQSLPEGWIARLVDGNWVTAQSSLLEPTGLEKFSGPFPRSGCMRNGALYRLPTLARRTSASGSGLWPTPRAAMTGDATLERCNDKFRNLETAVARAMWPTPSARDYRHPNARPYSERGGGTKGEQLPNAVRFRTPQARDGDERGPSDPKRREEQGHSVSLHDQIGGSLNPSWVELLLGLPAGWTDLGAKAGKTEPQE